MSNHFIKDSSDERTVRLFRNGRNQAIRIPREFELPGDEATIRREGDSLVIEPVRQRSLLGVLKTLEPLDIDFPDIDSTLGEIDDVDLG